MGKERVSFLVCSTVIGGRVLERHWPVLFVFEWRGSVDVCLSCVMDGVDSRRLWALKRINLSLKRPDEWRGSVVVCLSCVMDGVDSRRLWALKACLLGWDAAVSIKGVAAGDGKGGSKGLDVVAELLQRRAT